MTPEQLTELERLAKAAKVDSRRHHAAYIDAVPPDVVLGLLEMVRDAERLRARHSAQNEIMLSLSSDEDLRDMVRVAWRDLNATRVRLAVDTDGLLASIATLTAERDALRHRLDMTRAASAGFRDAARIIGGGTEARALTRCADVVDAILGGEHVAKGPREGGGE